MKRYFAWIFVLILLIPCLTIPASATGAYDENISENIETISGDIYDWFVIWYDYFVDKEYGFTLEDPDGDGVYSEIPRTNFEMDLISIYDYCTEWVWDFYDYFFTADQTFVTMGYTFNSSTGTIATATRSITGTGFQRDLNDVHYNIVNGLFHGFKALSTWLSSVFNILNNYLPGISTKLNNLLNYFTVADETIIKHEYSYNSENGYDVQFQQVSVTSFIADLHVLISPLENLLFAIFGGDYSQNSDIDDEVIADQTEASEILDILDDVTKPDQGELEDLADISGYVDSSDVSALSDVFKPLFESAVFLPCIMLNLTFMLVGYVLFGKR